MKKTTKRKVLKNWAQNLLMGIFALNCVLLVSIDDFEICAEFFMAIGGMVGINALILCILNKYGNY